MFCEFGRLDPKKMGGGNSGEGDEGRCGCTAFAVSASTNEGE